MKSNPYSKEKSFMRVGMMTARKVEKATMYIQMAISTEATLIETKKQDLAFMSHSNAILYIKGSLRMMKFEGQGYVYFLMA